MFSSRFRRTLRKREAVLTRKFLFSFSCNNFVPFPECSPETGEKCITFLRFFYHNKSCVCNVLWIPKGKFGYHANMTFVFHMSDLTEMCFDFYNVIDDYFRSCFKLRTHAVILIHDLGSTKFWHVFFPFPENSPETGSCFDTKIFVFFFMQ